MIIITSKKWAAFVNHVTQHGELVRRPTMARRYKRYLCRILRREFSRNSKLSDSGGIGIYRGITSTYMRRRIFANYTTPSIVPLHYESRRFVVCENRFPYSIPPGIMQAIMWADADFAEIDIGPAQINNILRMVLHFAVNDRCNLRMLTSATSNGATSGSNGQIGVTLGVGDKLDICWMINPPNRRSIPSMWHCHIFLRNPSHDTRTRIRNGSLAFTIMTRC